MDWLAEMGLSADLLCVDREYGQTVLHKVLEALRAGRLTADRIAVEIAQKCPASAVLVTIIEGARGESGRVGAKEGEKGETYRM